MKLKFKYSIGDKVLLTKDVEYVQRAYFSYNYDKNGPVFPLKYEIIAYGFKESDKGIEQYYQLYSKEDKYLQYHNQIPENLLEPDGENHPVEVETEMISNDGKPINLGDTIYDNLYWNGKPRPNITFAFTGHGRVVSKAYRMEKGLSGPSRKVYYERDFLCTYPDGKERRDGAQYGTVSDAYLAEVSFGVDDEYVENFAKEISKKSNRCYMDGKYDGYAIEQWLKHLGIYEKTMERIKYWQEKRDNENSKPKVKSSKKDKKGNDKLADLLATLTEEEKEKLKAML